jgi:RND family efflux transporter MFP subunit
MDRPRSKSGKAPFAGLTFKVALPAVLLAAGVAIARIDFSTARVNLNKVTIETVQQGTMEIKVSANGQLVPKNIEYIASQVSGTVARKYVKPGDQVRAGQPILDLTNPQLLARAEEAYSAWQGAVAELKASSAELKSALLNDEVALTEAQFNLERAQLQLEAETKLVGKHIVAEIEYKRTKLNVAQLAKTRDIQQDRLSTTRDNVQVELEVKQSRVTELARALERARNDAANLKITAGLDGIVQAIGVDVGQQLEPGSPVGRIAQPEPLYAELRVPAREAADVAVGQSVVVDTHSGTVEGVVTRLDPAVTEGTVVVDADLTGPRPPSARPQLPIEGVIYLTRLPNTLYVGKPAYVKSNSDVAVYKLDASGGYARRVMIRCGKSSLNYVQVLGGLQAGDRIITSDSGAWRDKDRILIN